MTLQRFGSKPEPESRVLYGLVTGIGFVGGSAIAKNNDSAKAASIWSAGAIGAAVAFGN